MSVTEFICQYHGFIAQRQGYKNIIQHHRIFWSASVYVGYQEPVDQYQGYVGSIEDLWLVTGIYWSVSGLYWSVSGIYLSVSEIPWSVS